MKRSLECSQWYSNGVQPKVARIVLGIFSINHQSTFVQQLLRSPFGLHMQRSALRGKREIRINSRAQDKKIQKNTQKDYECHSNDSCIKILFAPVNSPIEAMRHHVKHWSLLLLHCAVASDCCPFDLLHLVYIL